MVMTNLGIVGVQFFHGKLNSDYSQIYLGNVHTLPYFLLCNVDVYEIFFIGRVDMAKRK